MIENSMRIYFDHNATTPVDPRVLEVVLRVMRDEFGNPSSVHHFGQRAKAVLDDARSAVAALIGAGGLGAIMFQGLFANALDLVLLGAVPVILLAVAVDAALKLAVSLMGRRAA